jgi:hypothetical protein
MDPNKLAEIAQKIELERFEIATQNVKKYVKEKLSARGYSRRDDQIAIWRHFGHIVIVVSKGNDLLEILTPIEIWGNGGTDPGVDFDIENFFPKHS